MKESDVKRFLRLPCPEVIRLYVSYGNLTHKEEKAVDLCIRHGYTQAETAEMLDCSEDSVQKHCSAGLKKLAAAWNGNFVVERLLK